MSVAPGAHPEERRAAPEERSGARTPRMPALNRPGKAAATHTHTASAAERSAMGEPHSHNKLGH